MSKNYKLIYDVQPYLDAERAARFKLRKAQEELDRAEAATKLFLSKQLGENEVLLESNVCCIAHGIPLHVYAGKASAQRGVGHFTCIFCGCDDGDL